MVGVVAEAGVGKSRLLLQFREEIREEEYSYLEGRCIHYGDSMPYLPVIDMLRSCFDIKDVDKQPGIKMRMRERTAALELNPATVLPPLQDILSMKVEDEDYHRLDPPQKRERVFEAIRSLLIALGQTSPVVLAVEDLHWIDKTSEEFLT